MCKSRSGASFFMRSARILHSVTQNVHVLPLTFEGKDIILIMTRGCMKIDIAKP